MGGGGGGSGFGDGAGWNVGAGAVADEPLVAALLLAAGAVRPE
jgi:hypothetical protein